MTMQWLDHLFVIKSQGLPGADPYRVDVFLEMGEFEYLGIEPQDRPHPDHVLIGETKKEAVQRAKDQINGQMLLL